MSAEELPPEADIAHAVGVLRLLADQTRLSILVLLSHRELSVGAIAERLGRPAPAVSQHLAKLRAQGLVTTRREGTTIHYSQPDWHLTQLISHILHHSEHVLYDEPPHHRGR